MSQWKEISVNQLQGNPFEMIGHDWMLITAEKDGKANTMTASWGGLGIMWNKSVAFITIRPQRFTKEFIDNADTFSLTFFDESYRKTLGYLGSVSGRDEDKIAKAELTLAQDTTTTTPYFEEAKTVLICRKLFAQPYTEAAFLDKTILDKNYPEKDLHTLYIGEITKVLVKEMNE
jgi:flavin reductase (DIM6/NTAB) family NADH-FMN oxidoreductase RutF